MFDDLRAVWGARASKSRPTLVSASRRTEFMAHYDGGAHVVVDGHADCLARVRHDQAFHMDSNGWSDIGYTGLVCQHGRAIEGRGIDTVGAHCPGHNTTAYGFQFMVGGDQAPTPAAFARMARLRADCQARSGHALRLMGHRDGYATACPGTIITAWVRSGGPTPNQEDDMPLTEDDARTILTSSAVLKNPFAPNPDAAPRVAASYVLEQTAARVAKLAGPAPVSVDLDALAAKVADLLAARLKD